MISNSSHVIFIFLYIAVWINDKYIFAPHWREFWMNEKSVVVLTFSCITILLYAQFHRCLAVISVFRVAAPMFSCSSASLRIDCFFLMSSMTSSTFVAGPVAVVASFAAAFIIALASPPIARIGCGCTGTSN